jgi:dTDP-4-dehydrorhamnose 3,5-epimerase-like enzyme
MELSANQALLIPNGWWHEVFTHVPTAMVNYWFKPHLKSKLRQTIMHLHSPDYLDFLKRRM